MQRSKHMASRRPHAQERRKDRRIPVVARVRFEAGNGGPIVQADLVDVSAGGLRATCEPPVRLEVGGDVQVEITVQDAADARHPPLVNLSGRGRVVRVDQPSYDKPYATALAFTGALTVREPFAQMLLF
jgi:hypothetical protein